MAPLIDYRGSQLPDLEGLGLKRKMPEASRLIAEHVKHVKHRDALGTEQMELEQEIRDLEHRRTLEWGEAIRSGAEPPSDEIIQAKKGRLEEATREKAAVEHAAALSYVELLNAIPTNAEEWDAEVQARGEKVLAEAQEIAQKLSLKLSEVEPLVHLHAWFMSGGQRFSSLTPATVSVDNIIYERQRELGLLDPVEVVG